jgi:hypothetical protein
LTRVFWECVKRMSSIFVGKFRAEAQQLFERSRFVLKRCRSAVSAQPASPADALIGQVCDRLVDRLWRLRNILIQREGVDLGVLARDEFIVLAREAAAAAVRGGELTDAERLLVPADLLDLLDQADRLQERTFATFSAGLSSYSGRYQPSLFEGAARA